MRTQIERRMVSWDPATATLTVGARSTVVACEPGDNECLLRTYLGLVAEQRDVRLGLGVSLRRDDVAVLAELLDLDDDDLESRLVRILRLSEAEAKDLTQRLRRHKVVAAAVGVGLLAGVPASQAVAGANDAAGSDDDRTRAAVTVADVSPAPVDDPVVVEVPATTAAPAPVVVTPPAPLAVEEPPAPAPQPAPASAPEAPAADPEVEIGHSVTYERDPSFVPPEGVDIGDAMVIERDAPPRG